MMVHHHNLDKRLTKIYTAEVVTMNIQNNDIFFFKLGFPKKIFYKNIDTPKNELQAIYK